MFTLGKYEKSYGELRESVILSALQKKGDYSSEEWHEQRQICAV